MDNIVDPGSPPQETPVLGGESPPAPIIPQEPPLSPKTKKWPIIIGIVIVILLAGAGGFFFYRFQQSRKAILEKQAKPTEIPMVNGQPEVEIVSTTMEIIENTIYQVSSSGERKVLVTTNNPLLEVDSIGTLLDVKLSPDELKICFIGWPPGPDPSIYYSDLSSDEVFKVDWGKNCFWSPDSQKIAFNNHATDISPIDVFVYDLISKETKNLTENASGEGFIRYYELPKWLDSNKISVEFTAVDMPYETTRTKGASTINVSTGEVIDN